jgi:hypothetical protein
MLGMGAILGSAVLYAANLVMQRHQAQMAPRPRSPFSNRSLPRFFCRWPRWSWGSLLYRWGQSGWIFRRRRRFLRITTGPVMGLGAGAGASLAAHRIFGLSVGRIDGVDMV